MTKDSIIQRLINQGYDAKSASLVASELQNVTPSLRPLVEAWLNGEQRDYEAEGYTLQGLMDSRRMTYPAALLTIDWLLKEPAKARASLLRGMK